MTDLAVASQVVEVVRSVGRVAPTVLVGGDSRLVEDLGIDSLDLVAVFLAVQDRFDVVIEDDDVPNLKTVADVVSYVSQRQASQAA
jgi:acyl carrier protein